jgi:hypothetical protein
VAEDQHPFSEGDIGDCGPTHLERRYSDLSVGITASVVPIYVALRRDVLTAPDACGT